MTPNNYLTVLPFYKSRLEQNARRWWIYDRIYPLYTPAGFLLPFQIIREGITSQNLQLFRIYKKNGELVGDFTSLISPYIKFKVFSFGYNVIVYGGQMPVFPTMPNGQYYALLRSAGQNWYSEIFTVVNDMEPYLEIQWWDVDDFVLDSGIIVYKYANGTQFKNKLYLQADIAKPEYVFEEEGEMRDGYFFPIKQISEKKYRFSFLASEYLLDAMRLIRMSDHVVIKYQGRTYIPDTFLITPKWESNGDVATVEAEFETDTVAKKLGRGYVIQTGGDFNNDFNADFNNQQ